MDSSSQSVKPSTSGSESNLPKKSLEGYAIPKVTFLVVGICWFAMFSEGYDLAIYGAVLPAILDDPAWKLSPAMAGSIASYALFGMLIGAVISGTITDIFGRKKVMALCITIFSISMIIAALAPTPQLFGIIRFIGGLALGGVIPTASALTIEYSPIKRRSLMYAIMYTGYAMGGVFSAFLSILFLADHSWRIMFWIGALPILAVPFILKFLPESLEFLVVKNRVSEAEQIANKYNISIENIKEAAKKEKMKVKSTSNTVAELFSKQNIRPTIFFWITFFMGLFTIYGLTTWLPQMMRSAGYPLGSSIGFLLMLNFSAAVGAILAGVAADKWGSKKVIIISYLLASISIALLSVKASMLVVYGLVGVAGFGTIGTTLILNAYISKYFDTKIRATSLGWALGFGRIGAILGPILAGLVISWNFNLSTNFYIFALAAVIAAIAVIFIPKSKQGEV
ncbi:MFS transporter [Bacillus massiliigorillae]|uniref:MFS transporter n=1 Tax=Bacillus massiliigorillae TaxID=1243664 RepID=UPI0003A9928B|nr:aromatic acid/H+ symport family MFS transporter [Bacillus massiliigorillae]